MKIEAPKKESRESAKWEEHMQKKAGARAKDGEAEIIPAKKKQSVAPVKGHVKVKEPAKAEKQAEKAKPEKGKEAGKEIRKVVQKREDEPAKKPAKIGIVDLAKEVSIEEKLDDLNILRYPLVTEKAVNMIEAENKLTFVVDRNATKPSVRNAVESLYKVRVKKVSMLRDMKARKRAIVTLHKGFKAGEIATKLGVI